MHKDRFKVEGFVRIQFRNRKDGQIQADSGWTKNTVTEHGFDDYIVGAIGGVAASSQVGFAALGTQTNAVNSTQPLASGEGAWAARKATTNTLVGAGTLQATASWDTDEATQSNPGALALHAVSNNAASSACAIATYASSAKTTDQTINATYQLRFS